VTQSVTYAVCSRCSQRGFPDGTPTANFATNVVGYASLNQGVAALGGSPGANLQAIPQLPAPAIVPSSPAAPLVPAPILPGLLDGVTGSYEH